MDEQKKYIDAEEAKNVLLGYADGIGTTAIEYWGEQDKQEMIDAIWYLFFAVQPVKRGRWIWDKHTGTYHCSECGATSPGEDQDGEHIDCPEFCCKCGAIMSE